MLARPHMPASLCPGGAGVWAGGSGSGGVGRGRGSQLGAHGRVARGALRRCRPCAGAGPAVKAACAAHQSAPAKGTCPPRPAHIAARAGGLDTCAYRHLRARTQLPFTRLPAPSPSPARARRRSSTRTSPSACAAAARGSSRTTPAATTPTATTPTAATPAWLRAWCAMDSVRLWGV